MLAIITFDDGLLGTDRFQIQIISDMPSPCHYGDGNEKRTTKKRTTVFLFIYSSLSASIPGRKLRPVRPQAGRMVKSSADDGAIPANVSENIRAIVTAGLAKDVEAVNQ